MGTVKRSTSSGGGESGGSEEEEGIATMDRSSSPIAHRGRSHWKASWMGVGLAVLLIVQLAVVSAHPTTPTPINPNLGSAIDIPSEVNTPSRDKVMTRRNQTEYVPHHYPGHVIDMDVQARMVLKRSEKTIKDYNKFLVKNCRDIENADTFLSWEHDKFATELKTTMLKDVKDPMENAVQRSKLGALTESDFDLATTLKSLCKHYSTPVYEGIFHRQMTFDHHLENEIVNGVFAFMYKGGQKLKTWKMIHMDRSPKQGRRKRALIEDDEDEDFAKEVNRALRR